MKTKEQLAEEFAKQKQDEVMLDSNGKYYTNEHFLVAYESYLEGYDAATPKWIPVSERLPEKEGRYPIL
jgi:hypothetical protein